MPYALLCLILIFSIGLYVRWGAYAEYFDYSALNEIQASLEALHRKPNMNVNDVKVELLRVENKIKHSSVALARLGEIYLKLGFYEKARDVYKQAKKLDQKAEYQYGYLYCESILNHGQLSKELKTLAEQLLAQEEFGAEIRNLLAVDAYQKGEFQKAVQLWQEILNKNQSEELHSLQIMIEKAKAQMAATGASSSKDPLKEYKGVRILVSINISQDLKTSLQNRAQTLFVFAKRDSGSPMPVAVRKVDVNSTTKWPLQIALDSSHAMIAENNLDSVKQIVVGARLSKSGNPLPQSGDWEGLSPKIVLKQGEQAVEILVNLEKI